MVEEWETEFTAKEEPVGVRIEAVIGEPAGQGMQRDAGGRGKEQGEDVLSVGGEGGHGSE